jgi:DNA polymerase I
VPTTPQKPTVPAAPQPGSGDRLLLLDGHSLAYRAFFALPAENFSTTTGQPTNAVYGFTAMLINVLRDERPTHIAVAFDRSEPTFRHEQYVEYKANRRETPTDFRGQLSLIFEVLDAMGIARMSVAGYEADDLIATLATQASPDMSVLIVTGDRDALQLVNDSVTVLMTRRGISDMTRFTPEAVVEKYGLTPAQYPDFAAVRGDPSDNLPSIPGVGEKTAAKWITEFGSLADLVDRVGEVKGKAGEKLREHLASVLLNRQLTELARDVPIGTGPQDLRPVPWDREQIHQLFDTLQFRVLRDRLYSTLPNGIVGDQETAAQTGASDAETFDIAATVLGPGEVASWLAEHASAAGRSGLAASGTWGRGTGSLDGLAIAAPDGQAAYGRRPAQGPARREGANPRPGRPRPHAGRPDQRHGPRRLPGAARSAVVQPLRSRAPVPEQGAARCRGHLRAAHPGHARCGPGGEPARRAGAGHRGAGRRPGHRPGSPRGHRAAGRR